MYMVCLQQALNVAKKDTKIYRAMQAAILLDNERCMYVYMSCMCVCACVGFMDVYVHVST
jgi:hypothetical protein